jgi:ribosome-binding ATPase YchF (GTP1/OBG family)
VKLGLVGFAGSGKTTLFTALGGDPSAGNVATIALERDSRFQWLCRHYEPKKRTPASFALHDLAGLPPPGEESSAARIAAVRDDVECLLLVVRGFATDDYFYPRPVADPARDAADLVAELILADLGIVTRRVEKLEVSVTKPTPKQEEERRELAALLKVQEALEAEVPVKEMDLTPDEERVVRGYSFLSSKPWALLLAEPDEGSDVAVGSIGGPFQSRLACRVRLETELLELPDDERSVFMEEMGLTDLILPHILDDIFRAMGMIRFYTVSEKEVHAWEIRRGATALDAAGRIHTDLKRGFIRAEIFPFTDFRKAGGEREAKAAGLMRLEGKEYVVEDGDIIVIRFSV